MTEPAGKLSFHVIAHRLDAHGSVARCKSAELSLDTALSGRLDAFNPAELLLAALSACMIKSIERVTPILKFQWRGVEVRVHGVRQDVPPRLESIDYETWWTATRASSGWPCCTTTCASSARCSTRWRRAPAFPVCCGARADPGPIFDVRSGSAFAAPSRPVPTGNLPPRRAFISPR